MRGTIKRVYHQQGSGIAAVLLEIAPDHHDYLYADAGPLFRALHDAFGGHPLGQEVEYESTGALLLGFTPVEEDT